MRPFTNNLLDQEFLIQASYLTPGSKRRSGFLMTPGVKFIVAHDTGNPGSTARGNVRFYERSRDEISASAHLFVDDTQIIECIPALTGPPEKAWHVLYKRKEDNILYGHNSNDAAIGVEYCFGGNIIADEAYRRVVWVMAYACWRFNLDPAISIVGHHILDPGRKIDPMNGLSHSRRSYSQLLKDVVAVFQQGGGMLPPPPPLPGFPKKVSARGFLNIRQDEPFRRARIARQVARGASFTVQGLVMGEQVNGIDQWFDLGNNEFCWSGAVS
jgi:N-acetylmuramoyl-L-alanine amidase